MPSPTAAGAIAGKVTAPASILASPQGLVSTDGQPRLPFQDSGLLANLAPFHVLAATRSLQATAPAAPVPPATAPAAPAPTPSANAQPGAAGPVSGALVVLGDLDGKTFLDANNAPLSTTTLIDGSFQLPNPGPGRDVIVTAYPSSAQRLTAWVADPATADVDVATTLATELLRGAARLAGRTLASYSAENFARVVAQTRTALANGTIASVASLANDLGTVQVATSFDLRLDQTQSLENQYAIALSAVAFDNAAIKAISDGWTTLLGTRPLAVTTRLGDGREPAVTSAGTTGDQLPGAAAVDGASLSLGDPEAIAVAKRGDIFIACAGAGSTGGSIRWLQPGGRVTSVALPRQLGAPSGLAIASEPDAAGTGALYVSDETAQRVYKLALVESGNVAPVLPVICGEDVPVDAAENEPESPYYVDGPPSVDGTTPATSRWRLADEGPRQYLANRNPIPNPARFALLSRPGALALDELGNLYIADRGNQRIRMLPAVAGAAFGHRTAHDDGSGLVGHYDATTDVLAAGCLYTICGNPTWDPSRTPLDPDGHWFGDFAGDGGQAQLAKLADPSALVFSGGWLYVADRENQRVRRISRASGVIETVAGLPTGPQAATRILQNGKPTDFAFPAGSAGDGGAAAGAQLAFPSGLAIDERVAAHPKLYIADQGSGRLRLVDLSAGTPTISSVAGRVHDLLGAADRVDHDQDGEARSYVDLFLTRGLALDANGNLLFADGAHRRLRQVWLQWN